jgi:hypothetical protein
MYASGVLVPAESDAFCVLLPSDDGRTVDTYLGFLKEPPSSSAVKGLQFSPGVGEEPPTFKTDPGEAFRMDLPWELPPDHGEGGKAG